MKITKTYLLLTIVLTTITCDSSIFGDETAITKTQCKSSVLQFYGLQGPAESEKPDHSPNSYANRNCPQITNSCCTEEDFKFAHLQWQEKLHNIKGYLTKSMRILQKILMTQSGLIDIASKYTQDPFDACTKIDATFFNAPVGFEDLYHYIKSAYKSMAYIQKGFYCTVCDAENQKFLMVKPKHDSFPEVHVSRKSCHDLIHYFKEFIMFKAYYFDSFALNLSRLNNCVFKSNDDLYAPGYDLKYQEFKDCLENGQNCELVCNEFRLGGGSSLFVGLLYQYEKIYVMMDAIFKRHKVDTLTKESEIVIPQYKVKYFEFFRQGKKLTRLESELVKPWRFYRSVTRTKEEGLDLFGVAQNSNFYLTDQYSNVEKGRIFNNETGNRGEDSLLSSGEFHAKDFENANSEGSVGKEVEEVSPGKVFCEFFLI